MLFWMPWKSTVSTLLHVILQALCAVWGAGAAGLHHPSFQGCTSPEHDTAHSQTPWPTFSPPCWEMPGWIPSANFFFTF